jgi:hypothetical protein
MNSHEATEISDARAASILGNAPNASCARSGGGYVAIAERPASVIARAMM